MSGRCGQHWSLCPGRPFDQEAADVAQGVAWKDVPTNDSVDDTKQSSGRRRGRRRDRG